MPQWVPTRLGPAGSEPDALVAFPGGSQGLRNSCTFDCMRLARLALSGGTLSRSNVADIFSSGQADHTATQDEEGTLVDVAEAALYVQPLQQVGHAYSAAAAPREYSLKVPRMADSLLGDGPCSHCFSALSSARSAAR